MISSNEIKKSALDLGFNLVAVSSVLPDPKEEERYLNWRDLGYAGSLQYMVRDLPRRWVPQDLLPEAKSIVTFAVNFFSGAKRVESKYGYGRVARYAWGKDYHIVIKERLEEWVKLVRESVGPSFQAKILVDSGPLLERSFARRSGLGFVGKNTVIISKKYGSFIFLSEVLTNLELESDEIESPPSQKDDCGSCRECIDKCPTGALVAPRQLDARKCISYWTIENKGEIPLEMRPGIGDWIFGCDICQEVCPYVGLSQQSKWKEFFPESGCGPYLSLLEVLSIREDKEFKVKFEGTPLLRSKRAGLLRNACIVSANQKFREAIPLLEECAAKDSSDLVRNSAKCALERIN